MIINVNDIQERIIKGCLVFLLSGFISILLMFLINTTFSTMLIQSVFGIPQIDVFHSFTFVILLALLRAATYFFSTPSA